MWRKKLEVWQKCGNKKATYSKWLIYNNNFGGDGVHQNKILTIRLI